MIEIKSKSVHDCQISIPGSKSHTHRALVASALADGQSIITNGLNSEDTGLTIQALRQLGVKIKKDDDGKWRVSGGGGRFDPCEEAVYLGNSGTSMRLISALAALGMGPYVLKGTKRMHQRPIGKLLNGLRQIGVEAKTQNHNDCPPVIIDGKNLNGGAVELDCSDSSQYLSAILMIAPYTPKGMKIHVTNGPVSRPYIDMTLAVMEAFGQQVTREAYSLFKVEGNQRYQPTSIVVEPDASNAGYFWAVAAITGISVTVEGTSFASLQGDVHLADLLEKMGCRVQQLDEGINVTGSKNIKGIDVDMSHMPDMVPTLGVVAAFAQGVTTIRGIGHLKIKECNRLDAVATELRKMGISVETGATEMMIHGGEPRGATIDTYDDHRMAMSFAVAGLRAPGTIIQDETCVEKSFPRFWDVFSELYS